MRTQPGKAKLISIQFSRMLVLASGHGGRWRKTLSYVNENTRELLMTGE